LLKHSERATGSFDVTILVVTVVLCAFGLLMVYSASSAYALKGFGDSAYFLKRQLLFLTIGLGWMALLMHTSPRLIVKFVYPIYALGLVLLALVLVPGIGKEVGGARRWIDLGFVAFQPSEFAKLALVVYLAYSLHKKRDRMDSFSIGFLSHLVMGGAYVALLLLEPDFGMAAIVLMVMFSMLFVGGLRPRYIALSVALAALFFAVGTLSEGYRLRRVIAFLNPWKDPLGSGYQAVQSFVALGVGGPFGTGLGNSTQKLFFLPEAHTDFIFSIIGEELGFVTAIGLILLYGVLVFRGMRVALRARDLLGCYLAFGCTLLIGLQAATNMAVAVGLLPTKGITLPLVSYGGTSLVGSLMAVGVILSVSREGVP